nr:alpha-ketoglutarate-dependent dioxygenase alkB homolog 6 [Ipomoea batatas]
METNQVTKTGHLDKFIVGSVPTVIYIPNFIGDTEEEQIAKNIYGAPVSKWKSLKNRRLQNWGGVVHEKGLIAQDLPPWLTRITQRIQEETGLFPSAINHVLINEYLPDQGIMPHQDGPAYYPVVAILSLGSPVVMDFTLHPNLRSSTESSTNKIDDKVHEEGGTETNGGERLDDCHSFSILLMPRSLLIFKDKAYAEYLHGIKDSEMQRCDKAVNVKDGGLVGPLSDSGRVVDGKGGVDDSVIHRTSTRLSLTCRVVTKVHKNLFRF